MVLVLHGMGGMQPLAATWAQAASNEISIVIVDATLLSIHSGAVVVVILFYSMPVVQIFLTDHKMHLSDIQKWMMRIGYGMTLAQNHTKMEKMKQNQWIQWMTQ